MRLMADFRDRYLGDLKGCTVLDVGAMIVRGQHKSYRQLFGDYRYAGMDIASGKNVDIVGYDGLGKYDVVISGQVMEHVRRPWEWLKVLAGLYREYICIIAPNTLHEHRYPIDTYRYFPDGMRDLFDYAGITPVEIRKVGPDTIGVGANHHKFVVYYTDSQLEPRLANAVRIRLEKAIGALPIISVSQKPLKFGHNICVGEKPRSEQSIYEQVLVGLKATAPGSIIYLCEHDVFYHPSHFVFWPKTKKHAYFNTNRYYWKRGVGSFLRGRCRRAMSQCVAYREMLIHHYEERLAAWEKGPAPMRIPFLNFMSERPNVDIRHGGNLTPDGKKRKWMQGGEGGVVNLPGWGSPLHFQRRMKP